MNTDQLRTCLQALNAADAEYASRFVDELLAAAQQAQVSDVHLQPTAGGLNVCWRVDGVLQTVGTFPRSTVSSVVARLKVLARLGADHRFIAAEERGP